MQAALGPILVALACLLGGHPRGAGALKAPDRVSQSGQALLGEYVWSTIRRAIFRPASGPGGGSAEAACRAWCASPAFKSAEQQADGCLGTCLAAPAVADLPAALARSKAGQQPAAPNRTIYAAFYAEGERGSEGYDSYHMAEPSTDYLAVLRAADPSAEVWVLTDQATQLLLPDDVHIYRHTMDRARLGRNAWSNFYQYEAQAAFLRHMEAAERGGARPPVVFADMDAFILRPLGEVFRPLPSGGSMAIAFTLSDTEEMPINIGMQFVPGGAYLRAAAFFDALLSTYVTPGPFVQGQITVAQYLGLYQNRTAVLGRLGEAVEQGRSCREVPAGGLGPRGAGQPHGGARESHTVCLLPCHRYNHCHAGSTSCCTGMGPGRLPFSPQTPAELAAVGTSVFHMVGFRKPGLPHLRAAYERGGAPAFLEAFSRLPHGEEAWARAGGAL